MGFKRWGDLDFENGEGNTPLRTMEVMVLFKESVVSVGLVIMLYCYAFKKTRGLSRSMKFASSEVALYLCISTI